MEIGFTDGLDMSNRDRVGLDIQGLREQIEAMRPGDVAWQEMPMAQKCRVLIIERMQAEQKKATPQTARAKPGAIG